MYGNFLFKKIRINYFLFSAFAYQLVIFQLANNHVVKDVLS